MKNVQTQDVQIEFNNHVENNTSNLDYAKKMLLKQKYTM